MDNDKSQTRPQQGQQSKKEGGQNGPHIQRSKGPSGSPATKRR